MSLEHVRFILKPLVMPDRTFSWDENTLVKQEGHKGSFPFQSGGNFWHKRSYLEW